MLMDPVCACMCMYVCARFVTYTETMGAWGLAYRSKFRDMEGEIERNKEGGGRVDTQRCLVCT